MASEWIRSETWQQLDALKDENGRLKANAEAMVQANAQLEQQLAQARALLERVADFDSYDDYSIQPLQEEISAFLAQQQEPSNG